jgi:ribonuclease HI
MPTDYPTPWTAALEWGYLADHQHQQWVIRDADSHIVFTLGKEYPLAAQQVVRAVNSHAELLAACEALVAARSGDVADVIAAMDLAEAAVKKAKGESP